jgi:predicted MFS family arabinose efflux permease
VDKVSARATLMLVGVLGMGAFLVLPSIAVGLVADLGFTDQDIGRIATWQLIGLACGSALSILMLRHLHWRHAANVSLLVLLAGDIPSIWFQQYEALVVARFVAGVGGGLCVSLAAYGLGQTSAAERNFGLFLTAQVVFAILGSFAFPSVIDWWGLAGIFTVLCALELITLALLTRWVPVERWVRATPGEGNNAVLWVLSGAVMLGILFFYTAIGGFWTYIAPIGMDSGLSKQQTGNAVSIGLFGALVGSYAAAALNVRVGRFLPMAVALVLQLIAVAMLYRSFDNVGFIAAVSLFCIGWYIYVPYQFGLLAAVDRDGRPLMLLNAVAGLGSGLGPAIAASLLSDGFGIVYLLCIAFLLAAAVSHIAVLVLGREQLRT